MKNKLLIMAALFILFGLSVSSFLPTQKSEVSTTPTSTEILNSPTKTPVYETDTPTPTVFIPTAKPTKYIQPKSTTAPQQTEESWPCNCSLTCTEISSCAQAQYELNSCGCYQRDADHDGTACDSAPLHCQN